MEEINYENPNFYEYNISNEQDILSLSKSDSTSFMDSLKLTDNPLPKPKITFILTKYHQEASVNLLNKKTILKQKDSNSENDNENNGRWTREEQRRFAEAILLYGNNWKKIQYYIYSRNITQVRSHAQKFLMKLKENNLLKDRGLDQNSSWAKIINFLTQNLSQEELKEVLFSVEEIDQKNEIKKIKKTKKILKNNNININDNNEKNSNSSFISQNEEENNYLNIKMIEEEEEKDFQKFIECFNFSSGVITLNSSFEECSKNYEDNYFTYNIDKAKPVKYNNIL